jgi:RNA polymerase sigma factor (sigma-70 family)
VGAPPATREFEGFFKAEYSRLAALGAAISGSYEAGRDLDQETLLRAYRSWSRVAALEVPEAWARRVLINLAIDGQRQRKARERRATTAAREDAVVFDDPAIDGWWTAVRGLPERQRAVVVLHYLEDRSVADVASILGIAEGTVKATLAQARSTLARTLPRQT